MKNLEELKSEQYDLKAKLHEVVEFTNSEEYFTLSPREKSLVGQQRAGMEMYLNALTNRIYSKDEYSFDSSSLFMMPLLTSMFSSSWGGPSLKSKEELEKVMKDTEAEVTEITDKDYE